MGKAKVIGFYGYSGSGKTILIETLIRDLKASGYEPALIKETDKAIRMDTPGKDTYRFQDAGAKVVALASKNETDLIFQPPLTIEELIEIIWQSGCAELIIIESAASPEIPKIRIGEIPERKNTIWTYDDEYPNLLKKVKEIIGGKDV